MKNKQSLKYLFPVLMSFYVMGFVDVIGVAKEYIQRDFQLSNVAAQLLPSMVFVWFALISIPTGIFQDKKGKQLALNIGIGLTALGVALPIISYSLAMVFIGFAILGIGNTIIQVSANPLLLDVSSESNKEANLSLGQFVKAIASMLGPIIATRLAIYFDNWKLIFPIYAIISVIAIVWLASIRIEESETKKERATFLSIISLLKKPFIAIMILGTFLMVGFDVGINTNIAHFLKMRFKIDIDTASSYISIYFGALIIGRLFGGIFLRIISPKRFLIISNIVTLIGLAGLIFTHNLNISRIMIFVAGVGFSNIFPLAFALVVKRYPQYVNELSSLVVLSICGGAIIPPIIGQASTLWGSVAAIYVLTICAIYFLFVSFYGTRAVKQVDM